MLHGLGHADFVINLAKKQQEILKTNEIQNSILCRAIWNDSSVTTSCCIVFYASQPTSSGISLDHIFAKGKKEMNKLVRIAMQ